jgi:hypothetical protein
MAHELERMKEIAEKKKPRKGVMYAELPIYPSRQNLDFHVQNDWPWVFPLLNRFVHSVTVTVT